MINKYKGNCASCGVHVPAGKGSAVRSAGAWIVVCASTACHRKYGASGSAGASGAGASGAGASGGRRLVVEGGQGLVFTSYNASELPLLRAMPGAVWNGTRKAWTVSLAPEDRPRLLEVADKLKLAVEPSLRVATADLSAEAGRVAEAARAVGAYAYQVEGAAWLALQSRAILADDMGLGKTMQTVMSIDRPAIIVCPSSLKLTWAAEIAKWRPELKATILAGRGAWQKPTLGEVVITNYDILPEVADASGCIVVADEVHRCKSYQSGYTTATGETRAPKGAARAIRMAKLMATADRAIGLTGTPLLNRPFDLLGVLSVLDVTEKVFGGWQRFTRLFGMVKNRWGGWESGEVDPSVPERLRRVMLRRTKAEVLPHLPAKVRTERIVELTDKRLAARLDQAFEAWCSTVEADRYETAAHGERSRKLPSGLPDFTEFSSLRAALAEAKIPAMIEVVEDYEDAGKPLLVFSAHRSPIDALADREGWATITGDTPVTRRQEIVEAFQAGRLRGVGLTIAAGGVGLTLTAASDVLFVDRDWVPANNVQAEDRVHRIGQKATSVNIVVLTTSHVLDRHIARLLDEKMRLIEAAIEKTVTPTTPSTPTTPIPGAGGAGGPTLVPETDEELAERIRAREAAMAEVVRAEAREEVLRRAERISARVEGRYIRRELTEEDKATIAASIRRLAAQCDGAVTEDGVGFSKADQALGHWFVSTGFEGLAPEHWEIADKFCHIYRRQLGAGA